MAAAGSAPTLDQALSAERLERHVHQLARFGRTPAGGIDRPVYSPAWAEARQQVAAWMEEGGLGVRSDAAGNLFGRLEGTDPNAPIVLTGSHLDTVPNGGPLDGALGIHVGLAALVALSQSLGRPRRSLEVVAICEEEGARFPCSFWGARALIGALQPHEPHAIADAQQVTIAEAMRARALDPDALPSARRTDIWAFLELHIEQGPLLEQAGLPLGIVTAITGQHRAQVTVRGRPDHAGTTPMEWRRDAYLGAAEMALAVATTALRLGPPAVATVGHVRLEPGAVNVVPGLATFTVDARSSDPAHFAELLEELRSACEEIARRRELELDWRGVMLQPPQPLDVDLRALLGRTADSLGVPWMPLPSGAGHDSQVIARVFPTAMLFVPSQAGRSHCPDEWTPVEQVLPGLRVLAHALRQLAYEV